MSVVAPAGDSKRCFVCHKVSRASFACPKCNVAEYCSATCQGIARNHFLHDQHLCPLLQKSSIQKQEEKQNLLGGMKLGVRVVDVLTGAVFRSERDHVIFLWFLEQLRRFDPNVLDLPPIPMNVNAPEFDERPYRPERWATYDDRTKVELQLKFDEYREKVIGPDAARKYSGSKYNGSAGKFEYMIVGLLRKASRTPSLG